MKPRHFIIVTVIALIAVAAVFIWRDQLHRPRYVPIRFGLLNDDAYLNWLDGKSVTVTGVAGGGVGPWWREYRVYEHYQVDSMGAPQLFVRPPLSGTMPAERDPVWIAGVFHRSPNGPLVIATGIGPPPALWTQILIFAVIGFPVLAVLAIPCLAIRESWRRYRVRTRFRPGMCRACGYDLRGSSGRCPECGTIATQVVGRGGPVYRRVTPGTS